jgi:cytochrome P450
MDEIIDSYREEKDGEASVIAGLLNARYENGERLSRDAIRNEAAVIFMAGHETTANTLAWAWFLLSQSPRVATRLREEVDGVLGVRTPVFADVPKLAYARAVIEETLRLYPPVPILAREAMAATTISGRAVPKGSIVMVVPWLLHRNPKLWRDADAFRPERFLPGSDEKPSKYGYVPFSIGPRICAGLQFGMTESILCLAVLARAFDVRLVPGTDVQPVCRLTLRPGERLPMTVHPRPVRLQ